MHRKERMTGLIIVSLILIKLILVGMEQLNTLNNNNKKSQH